MKHLAALADTIKEARKAEGLTQEALADRAGISTRYLQQIEALDRKPSVTTLFKLCAALGLEPEGLLGAAWTVWKKESH